MSICYLLSMSKLSNIPHNARKTEKKIKEQLFKIYYSNLAMQTAG